MGPSHTSIGRVCRPPGRRSLPLRRHASYLWLLNGEVPFPEPFDDPKAPRQVCEMVDPFITKSLFNLKAFCESLPNKVITL
jgi:hypothetical protein